jgi:glycosyltransferase involved in cell wall biosynthesis
MGFELQRNLQLAPIYDAQRLENLSPAAFRHTRASASFVNAANAHVVGTAIDDFSPDVVYLWNLFGLGGLGLLGLLRHVEIPWVWHIMDAIPPLLCSLDGPQQAFPALTREFGHAVSGDYIVCSTRIADEIRAAGIDLGPSVHAIPNWIVGERPPPRRHWFAGGHLRIMNAGQVGQHKGTHILIETAADLLERGFANFSIDIYGMGDDWAFRGLANELGVNEFIHFAPPLPQQQLVTIYGDYDVFAFPTWAREPFGFAPLEAASRGCIPVISAECGIAEWFIDGVDCLKAARDATSFADRIAGFLDGNVDVQRFGTRSQNVVWRDFHIDCILPQIESILETAARRRRHARAAAGDFYPIARIAEGLTDVLINEGVA